MTTTLLVARCDNCGLQFPHAQSAALSRTFCDPCRRTLWQDEHGEALTLPTPTATRSA